MVVVSERRKVAPEIGGLVARSAARAQAFLARHFQARVLDAVTILFVARFHRIVGAKFIAAQMSFDEHYFLWEGFSVNRGLVPYRDFQEFKPPMIFLVNALALRIFGLEGMAYRHFFELLSLAGFFSLTVALLSRGTNRWMVAAVLALMIDHFFDGSLHDSSINNAESAGLDFFMIGCGILLVKTRWLRTQQVLGGAVLALVPMSKEPLALVTLAAWAGLLLLHRYEYSDARSWKNFALFTIAGVSSVVATWLIYMLATRSVGPYIAQVKMNIAYTKNYAVQLNWFPKNPAEGEFAESWKRLRQSYFNTAHVGIFVPLFAASIALWERRALTGIATLASLWAALYAVTVGHGFAGHYYIMAMTGTFFAAIVGVVALDGYSKRMRPMHRWISVWWIALGFLVLWGRYSEEKENYANYKAPAPPVSERQVAYVRSHSSRQDTIFTLGEPLLYVYSDRLSAVHMPNAIEELIQYYPGNSDEERLSEARKQLEENRPKIVVFGDDPVQGYARKERYIRAIVTPFLKEFGYTQVEEKIYVRP